MQTNPLFFKDGLPVHVGDVLYTYDSELGAAKFTVTGYSDGVIDSAEWGTCTANIEELTWGNLSLNTPPRPALGFHGQPGAGN